VPHATVIGMFVIWTSCCDDFKLDLAAHLFILSVAIYNPDLHHLPSSTTAGYRSFSFLLEYQLADYHLACAAAAGLPTHPSDELVIRWVSTLHSHHQPGALAISWLTLSPARCALASIPPARWPFHQSGKALTF
jgi:hypothetical protein